MIDFEAAGKSLAGNAKDNLNSLGDWAGNHPDGVLFATVLVMAAAALWGLFSWNNTRKTQGEAEEMAKRDRQLDEMFADGFGDVLFDFLNNDLISRQEYKRACRKYGLKYQLSDLLPRRNHSRAISATVRRNVATMRDQMAKVQPRIPGPKPGEDANLVVVRRRVFVAVGKTLK